MGLFPTVCKDCKEPFRRVGCHSTCKRYLEAKAEYDAKENEERKARKAERDADSAAYILKRN